MLWIYNLLSLLITIYSWVLVIIAFMSWVPALFNSVIGRVARRIAWPFLSLFQKVPTRIGIFDFTLFLGIIVLQILQHMLSFIFFHQW